MQFIPPIEMIVHETPHWRVNQRVGCPVPGYLMVGAKSPDAVELSDLVAAAQREIGSILAQATRILRADLGAERVYVGRYGHDGGHTVHFHVIPVYPWIVSAFHADPRYENEPNPNGADLTLFIWREYCNSLSPPPCPAQSVADAIGAIRRGFQKESRRDIRRP
jgi:diadenosine tetraphosphate (Ap4A) HIT family hydrolase